MAASVSIFEYTNRAYSKNFLAIVTMAVPGLVAMFVPALVGAPAYLTLGGLYLRTGSIPDLSSMNIAVILIGLLVSMFLMAFALVNINLVIKSERTLTNIGNEVMKHLSTTTLSVFWVYLVGVLALFIVQLLTYEWGVQKVLAPVLSGIVGLVLLFVPTAMVMDEARPSRALGKSVDTIIKKWPLVGTWIVVALLVMSVVDGLFLFVLPHPLASYLVLLFNSMFLLPYLVVMLGQIYISKYTILA